MEEDNKGKKGPVGVFITFQRLLLRYRLTPTKFLFFLIVFGFFASLIIIGLGGNENSSPNINNAPRPENTIGTPLTDNQLNILASKERELSEREREIALKLTELEEKQLELNKQEQNIRVKEQEIDSRERTVQNKQQKLSELEKRFNDIESQLNQLDNPQSNNNDNNDNNNNYNNNNNNNVDNIKREAVKGAFVYAWNGYKTKAWGQDELHPVDGSSSNWMGLGLTIIDSLDTLYIMGLKEEFNEAKEWIANNLRFDVAKSVSFFETTIRVIGGLLSAFELSKEQIFLNKADELGTRFLPAFNTPTGLPKTTINMLNGASSNPSWTGGAGVLSEMATVQLEFSYLSKYTNKPIYKEKAMKVYDHLNTIEKHNGLYSIYISTDSGRFTRNHITLGAMGDSFYEYLLKIYLLSGKTETKYLQMYDEAAQNIIDKLVKRSTPSNLVYIAELIDNRIIDKMDHLVCFAGAMFALGSLNFQGEKAKQHLQLGADITKTCYEFYHRTATGISGELVHFSQGNDFSFPGDARHYLLRPETVESLFVLWRITHDPIYREMGWEIFQAIDKHCKTTYGYSGIRDVTNPIPTYDNLQQSFFLAETLKYLYLLFSEDELIPLDKYVFNTEAHPLGIFQ